MKVNFNIDSNKLSDFLKFPELIYFTKNNLSSNLKKLIDVDFVKESIAMANKIKLDLEEYRPDIEKFFQGTSSKVLHLMDFIYEDLDLINYEDKDHLFSKLVSMSDRELISSLVTKILFLNKYYSSDNVESIDIALMHEELNSILDSEKKLFKFIKESELDSDFKWAFMIFVDNPNEYITEYIELMNSIYPIYERYYALYEESIIGTGLELKSFIETEGGRGLSDISNNILSETIFDTNLNINIFISFVSPNSITLSDTVKVEDEYSNQGQNIVFGINSLKLFEILKKEQEDKKLSRIDIFKSLGDETRYDILKMISQGVSPNKEIAKRIGVSGATVSYHINSFVENGVLNIKRIDNKLTHVIDRDILNEILKDFKDDFNL